MGLVDPHEAVWDSLFIDVGAVMLPVGDPIVKYLSNLHVCYRDLFDCVNFQSRGVQHLLDCSRRTFENPERYHLIQTQINSLFRRFLLSYVHLLELPQILKMAVVVRKRTTQVHNRLLVGWQQRRHAF